jgi:hypothetical protein
MKITALGVTVVIGSIVILAFVIEALVKHFNGNNGNRNDKPDYPTS